MIKKLFSRPRLPASQRPSFFKDTRAVAAVEFAVAFPVMLAFFLGVVVLVEGLRTKRTLERTALILTDVASRNAAITEDDIEGYFTLAEELMSDYGTPDNFEVVISDIWNEFDSKGDDEITVQWSRSTHKDSIRGENDVDDLRLPELLEGQSVVIVEIRATYTPMFTVDFTDGFAFYEFAARRPRFSNYVTLLPD